MARRTSIQVDFPCEVGITDERFKALIEAVDAICKDYEAAHIGRVMWPAGMGSLMKVNPMMLSDDEPIPFDDSVLSISCAERADYDCICTKCGKPQGDHKDHIMNPPAGDCNFEARNG